MSNSKKSVHNCKKMQFSAFINFAAFKLMKLKIFRFN